MLKEELALGAPHYPEKWQRVFPSDPSLVSVGISHTFWLDSFGPAIINDLTNHRTLTFPKAVLCLSVLLSFAEKSGRGIGDVEKRVRIRLANSYVPSLKSALSRLAPEERDNLVRPLGATPYVLDELADGFPVTSLYARKLVSELQASPSIKNVEGLGEQLKVETYSAADEVRPIVRSDGRRARDTIRAARYERDIFGLV